MSPNKLIEFFKRKLQKHCCSQGEISLNPGCEQFEANNWILSEFVAKKLVPIVGVHPYPLNELCMMASSVAVLKPTHIFEWGTNLGKSARIFYETSRRFCINARIYSIDLPEDVAHTEHPHEKRGLFVKNIKEVTLLLGDGLDTALSLCRKEASTGGFRPLIFIDGDHSYESVRRELQTIVLNVPNAAILLHDTFYQSSEAGYNTGPFRAIQDVLGASQLGYKRITQDLGLPGMTLLYKKR